MQWHSFLLKSSHSHPELRSNVLEFLIVLKVSLEEHEMRRVYPSHALSSGKQHDGSFKEKLHKCQEKRRKERKREEKEIQAWKHH